jgi:hypothetical protein
MKVNKKKLEELLMSADVPTDIKERILSKNAGVGDGDPHGQGAASAPDIELPEL